LRRRLRASRFGPVFRALRTPCFTGIERRAPSKVEYPAARAVDGEHSEPPHALAAPGYNAMTIRIIIRLLAVILVLFTALPLIRKSDWWIRIFDFPRLQILALSLLTVAAFPFFLNAPTPVDVAIMAAISLACVYQIALIQQYTVLHKKQVKNRNDRDSGETIKMITSNVLMDNRNAAAFLRIVDDRDPDILLAVETDDWWEEALRPLDERYPYSVKVPLPNTYGMLLFSRFRLLNAQVRYEVEDDVPSIHALLEMESSPPVELHCVHPRPPRPSKNRDTDKRDAELLLLASELEDSPKPVIVAGDLNDVAWSRTTKLFQKISGLLDPRVGRGIYNTFHAKYPFLRWPLDHVFHSFHFTLGAFKRLPYFGSDHFPIYIELTYDPDRQAQKERERADQSDKREAEKRIQEAA